MDQKTAVEWFIEKLQSSSTYNNTSAKEWDRIVDLYEQAKEMEKTQINRACYDGYYQEDLYDVRKYYDQTYNK